MNGFISVPLAEDPRRREAAGELPDGRQSIYAISPPFPHLPLQAHDTSSPGGPQTRSFGIPPPSQALPFSASLKKGQERLNPGPLDPILGNGSRPHLGFPSSFPGDSAWEVVTISDL